MEDDWYRNSDRSDWRSQETVVHFDPPAMMMRPNARNREEAISIALSPAFLDGFGGGLEIVSSYDMREDSLLPGPKNETRLFSDQVAFISRDSLSETIVVRPIMPSDTPLGLPPAAVAGMYQDDPLMEDRYLPTDEQWAYSDCAHYFEGPYSGFLEVENPPATPWWEAGNHYLMLHDVGHAGLSEPPRCEAIIFQGQYSKWMLDGHTWQNLTGLGYSHMSRNYSAHLIRELSAISELYGRGARVDEYLPYVDFNLAALGERWSQGFF